MDRFWSKVDMNPHHCWEWQGAVSKNGYGVFTIKRKNYSAHRFAYTLIFGEIPKGKGFHGTVIRHKCDNKTCVNPDHLELGSITDNNRDTVKRGRYNAWCAKKTHCPQNHEYTEENTYVYKGRRNCRTCANEKSLARYHAKKRA